MAVKIITEKGCDLPPDLTAHLDVHLVPLVLRFGDRVVSDSDESRQQLWDRIDAGLPCETSGPSIGAYEEAFRPAVEAGHEVVCITLTGAHSVTYSSAWAAAQQFAGRVTVIDSLSISLGYGFQVLEAARLAAEGGDVATIVEAVEQVRQRTTIRFYLESLEQIRRGGRADALMPLLGRLGKALAIVPVLTFNEEGRIALVGPARGLRGGIKRLEDKGVTDVMVGFRIPYTNGPDPEPLDAKIRNLEMFAEHVMSKVNT